MLTLFWILFWVVLSALTVAAGWSVYERRRRLLEQSGPRLDDDAIHRIVETGELFVDEDEPLDLEAIDQEEERFWSETWDEPEDW
ncbi:MAG TPA: hypothetical protein VLA09_10725 [Longimicrobiales bacterium]|nr:hypothetical protein [Longimicrobiales bacterium]